MELQGALIQSPGKEQSKELQVSQAKVLGECDSVIITYNIYRLKYSCFYFS